MKAIRYDYIKDTSYTVRDFLGSPVAELHTPNAGGLGLILFMELRSLMPQLGIHVPQLTISTAIETQHRQINKNNNKKIFLRFFVHCD